MGQAKGDRTHAAAGPDAAKSRSRTFFGEPVALGFLAFTEAWERFSYYGMTSILVLYMSHALFTPERMPGIGGFETFRAALTALFGPMSTLALASQIYGLYTGFVYFTPVFGGWIADRFIGRKRAVMIGAVLMTSGHVAMAFDRSFLLALSLLVVGCGLLKGNISTQVGSLYPPDNVAGRTRAFAIFSMGINSGAILGPLAIGLLADRYGWHLGFGLAGCLMLIGLLTYMAGYRLLPAETNPASSDAIEHKAEHGAEHRALGRDDWKIIGALAVVMLITVFHSIAFYQNSNMALIWIGDWVDLHIAGFRLPVSWFNSIDPAASIAFVPVLFALWRFQSRRRMQRDELRLIGEGAWIAAAANIVLAFASLGGHKVSALYPLLYDLLLGISFLYYWPTLLALVSRTAPPRAQATLMGAAFLSLFVANNIIGIIGTWYERMTPTAFWSLNAGIAAAGGTLALLLRRPLARILNLSVASEGLELSPTGLDRA